VNSIRIFLVVLLVATITLVTFASALHGYRKGMQESRNLFMENLLQQAQLLNSLPIVKRATLSGTLDKPIVVESFSKETGTKANIAFQIFNNDGDLILRSANAPAVAIQDFKQGFSMVNFSGYRWGSRSVFNPETGTWIMVAERDDVRRQLAESIILETIFPVIAALPLVALIIWVVVSFGLRPIRELATQLRSRSSSNLSPVTLDNVPLELTQLAESANDMLKRLEASFNREKRFNSDVAHELRTPIAAMKIHMQNLMNELQTAPDSADKLQQGINRMKSLVEQMLTLNRITPENYITQFTNVDLFDVIKQAITDNMDSISDRQQELEFDGTHCTVYGDEFALETLTNNLIDNAVKYTPPGGKLLIRLYTDRDQHALQIMDSGPGISAEQRPHVFERFYRIGGDRHDSSIAGSGLGLSIVKYIVELHRARIVLNESEFQQGLCVTVIFPAGIAT